MTKSGNPLFRFSVRPFILIIRGDGCEVRDQQEPETDVQQKLKEDIVMDLTTILIIIVLLLVFGGGGFYWFRRG